METSTSFGYWLRRRRKALDLTQKALAQHAGCTADAIKKIESDLRRPSRQLAERLADCLAVPADERSTFLRIARAELSSERLGLTEQPTPPAAMADETATFLLIDIQDSTALWERHTTAMPLALARHDATLRQAVAARSGRLYQAFDDRMCAVFASASAALAAAIEAQRLLYDEVWSALAAPPVRMALHTGEALAHSGISLGRPVHWAARLLTVGHGGQILLSRATAELVRDALPPGVALRDLGERRLHGLGRPEQMFQVVAPNLPAVFPPLRTPDLWPNNLPAQPNLFVGRERERVSIRDLLRRPDVRLVTLTGPGGIGKTRLALAVAEDLLGDFKHGVWFVDLAPITSPELLVPRLAQALGVTESGSRPLVESLHAHLCTRQLLILLDNLEQVIEVAPQVARLLAAAPGLTLLATSRVPLHVSAEHERAVSPLALPGPQATTDLGRLAQFETVRLFVERAGAASASFTLTPESAPAVAEICRRLDGLPLAIELAAARIKGISPDALLGQLRNRLAVLTDGPRDLPARQRTLRDTIAWSFNLLGPREQEIFIHMAVFAGSWTPAAATAVVGQRSEVLADGGYADIEGVLLALTDNGLLRRIEMQGETPRFTMLETVREYALEQLTGSGAAVAAQRRHTHYYVALAEEARRWLTGPKRMRWLERLDAEYDNLREVLARSAAHADEGETLLRMGAALWWYWHFRGKVSEGRAWLQEALGRLGNGSPSVVLQWIRCGTGVLAWAQGDQAAAEEQLRTSVAGWRELADQRGLAYALTFQGFSLQYQFDLAGARKAQDEGVAIFRHGQDRWGLAMALAYLADLCYFEHDLVQARELFQESIGLARELEDGWNLAWALSGLGFIAYDEGESEQAEQLFAESIALLRGEGSKLRLASTLNKQGNLLRLSGRFAEATECYQASLAMFRELATNLVVAGPLHNLGFVSLHMGDNQRAAALFEESIRVAQTQEDWGEVATGLGGLAAVAAVRGEATRAARIFAAMERLLAAAGEDLDRSNRAVCDTHCADVRHSLGEARFAAAWGEGEAMPAEQIIAETLKALL